MLRAPSNRLALALALALSAPVAASAQSLPGVRVVRDMIPYPASRVREMESYSLRHYGDASAALTPRLIVLHYTWGPSYRSARATFAHNRPLRGESPGVCAHYVVDLDGTVYANVDPARRCRHVVGLNHLALGIEMVQPPPPRGTRNGGRWAAQQVLARPAQMASALALTRALQARYGIPNDSVIGHAMANRSPLFLDHTGARNTHGDWALPDVLAFRARL